MSKRKQQHHKENTPLIVVIGIVAVFLFALMYWQIFLYCVVTLFLLILLYVAFKIRNYFAKRAAPLMRDSRYISPQLRWAVWKY